MKPLHYGSCYTVSSSADLKINPQELHFTYKSPGQQQSYVQFSIRNTERVDVSLKNKEDLSSVWDTSLEPGMQANPSLEPHFIEQHREQLIQRTAEVEGVLDLLYGNVLDDEQYQRISLRETNPEKMRELYRLVPSWDDSCKDRLYKALRKKNPFLIADLEGI
ncbi:apoptosis-associated speck-like protein containing a CARD [Heteronotia binoei]|uniref:apoptosis-associated speck-like protein containing a CARD n=1 Tax=Heteronotia binoei TaxID=13085 RepID=UPI00292CD75D|nr:apoptosis-associated speck-like protein containing a CARD [Heteronotia binoei]XP_060112242.1 apoptosis-associated speck-like protein containing a CARD [Heteronotia binoei]